MVTTMLFFRLLRKQPILGFKHKGQAMEKLIYFDHNATTPYSPSVREYLQTDFLKDWQNPSAMYPKAQALKQKIQACRKEIAEQLHCAPKNLFFTSGATESINTVLSLETLKLNNISSIITSPMEHQATLKKVEYLNRLKSNKIKIHYVLHNKEGEINLEDLEELCSKNHRSLISLMSANNETGVMTSINKIKDIAYWSNCLVHVDAVQSLGKKPVNLTSWGVDFASFSGHKIGAMKGVGVLYAKKPFSPLLYGGGQEKEKRSGTYNFPAIYSLKLAMQDINLSQQKHVWKLRAYFENYLTFKLQKQHKVTDLGFSEEPISESNKQNFIAVEDSETKKRVLFAKGQTRTYSSSPFQINCRMVKRLSNISNIYCEDKTSEEVVLHLARKGICVSAGSACHASSPAPSHVIVALKDPEYTRKNRATAPEPPYFVAIGDVKIPTMSPLDYARCCVRISLSPSNTKEEIQFLIQSLAELYSMNANFV